MFAVKCPALDLCTQGRNVAEARYMITEASLLLLESCRDTGNLKSVLYNLARANCRRRSIPRKAEWDGEEFDDGRGWKRIGKIRLPARLP